MAEAENIMSKFQLVPDWSLKENESVKSGSKVRVHPYKLIRFAHKKWGVEKASKVAKAIIKSKYDRLFDRTKKAVRNLK